MLNDPTPKLHRFLTGALVAWGLLLAVSFPHRQFQGDEAWLGEQAYFLAHDGVIRSELFRGYNQQEERILVTHKLFIAAGALAVWLAGWGLTPLRSISLIAGLLTILLVARHAAKRPDASPLNPKLAALVLLASPLFFKFMTIYRPEILLAAFGFASYYLLSRYLETNENKYLAFAAVTAGAAVLVHLNGLIYISAGIVVLIINRRIPSALWFALIGIAVSLLYFADVVGHWDLFHRQLLAVPSLEPKDFRWDAPFWRLLDEHKRLFRKPEIIFTSSLFFGALAYCWKQIPATKRDILPYTIALMIGLGMIGQAKTTPYAIALFPFFVLVIARAGGHWSQHRQRLPVWTTVVACVLSAAFLTHAAMDDVLTTVRKQDVAADNRRLAAVLAPATEVLAPMDFIFNEIDHFHIHALMAVRLQKTHNSHTPLSFHQLAAYADSAGIPAIILNTSDRKSVDFENATIGDGYRVIANIRDINRIILKKK